MHHDQKKPRIQRRSFVGWLIGAVPIALGGAWLQKGGQPKYSKLGDDFLVVDGWVLPSAHFK